MEWWGIARALHLLGVVLWIGGVAMVTLVLLPSIRATAGPHRMALFERLEHRFARQSRWTTVLVGGSGLYLVHSANLWHRFGELDYWWMHAMLFVWAAFMIVLFVLEPLVLHRWFAERARERPESALRIISGMHWLLPSASLITIAGAAAGSHGVQLFAILSVLR